ncbi:MAG: adenylate/guanylate cyclase domain-containing protein [Planctomycetota bacterium]
MDEQVTVFFADICDSTELYEVQGDTVAHEQIENALKILARITANHKGKVIKTIGDEVMCSFSSADAAFRAAAEMHETLCNEIRVKTGFHSGPVLLQEDDLYGDTVNVASRVVGMSKAGEILMTKSTAEELSPALRTLTHKICQATFKGKSSPVSIYGVVLEDDEMTTVTQTVDSSRIIVGSLRTMVLLYQDHRTEVALDCPATALGRSADCGLIVDNPKVSRRHASIEYKQGAYYLTDHSTNGTYLVFHSGERQFLKREATRMPKSGFIYLGEYPEGDQEHAIEFWCGD